jgi:ankyrin repeat protein
MSAVHNAVMKQDIAGLTHILTTANEVDRLDREGRTPLFYAAKEGAFAIADLLIRSGANVNARDKTSLTPLHYAARFFQLDLAKLLIKNGAEVDARDNDGNTPLSDAVFESRGRGEMIAVLIAAGATKNLKNSHGVSPLELAQSISNFNISRFLTD